MVIGDGIPKTIVARNDYDLRTCDEKYLNIDSTKNTLKLSSRYEIAIDTATDGTDPLWSPGYKYTLTHNLGFKPIVDAYVFAEWYNLFGWRKLPLNYWIREVIPGMGTIFLVGVLYYQHKDDNTIVFYSGELGTPLTVLLYLDPRKDAWYE